MNLNTQPQHATQRDVTLYCFYFNSLLSALMEVDIVASVDCEKQ